MNDDPTQIDDIKSRIAHVERLTQQLENQIAAGGGTPVEAPTYAPPEPAASRAQAIRESQGHEFERRSGADAAKNDAGSVVPERQLVVARGLLSEVREASDAVGKRLESLMALWRQLDATVQSIGAESVPLAAAAAGLGQGQSAAAAAAQTAAQVAAAGQAHNEAKPASERRLWGRRATDRPPAPEAVAAPAGQGVVLGGQAPVIPAHAPVAPAAHAPAAVEDDASAEIRNIAVTAGPFTDIAMTPVVENAFRRIPGVQQVALRELKDNQALIDVTVAPRVALIAGLRKTLTIAFDVVDSSEDALVIRLIQPPNPKGA